MNQQQRWAILLLPPLLAALALGAQTQPVALRLPVGTAFRFVAYGDTRFTNPEDTRASNAAVRQALVQAIAEAHPAFISIGGDIVYHGDNADDWKMWDAETALWRQRGIPVYPALGNHDLSGDQKVGLANYFQRFPELKQNRYYSVRAGNTLLLVLDSLQPETSGAQGLWLREKLDQLPAEVDFVLVVLHHPPYTSSTDKKLFGGGHSARPAEQALANWLEERQAHTRARFVVFAGHVHNYERHEHGDVTYFVTGGGGAHPYRIERAPSDLYRDSGVNYHYLLVEVERGRLRITMNRLELVNGRATWTQPDSVTILAPVSLPAQATTR